MNDSTLTELKIIVERAVRPVRCSFSRKRRMREELLAHVSDVFDEEAVKLRDERAALERTARRFGNPAEVTKQLQASIPVGDVIDRLLCGQPGEPTLRASLRLATFYLSVSLIVFGAVTLLSGLATVWPTQVILFTVSSTLLLPAYMFSLTFATEWIRQAWYEPARRSRFKAMLLTFGWFAFSLALFEGVAWLSGTDAMYGDYLTRIWLTIWLAASIPWMPWCLAHVTNARIRSQQEWANLQID